MPQCHSLAATSPSTDVCVQSLDRTTAWIIGHRTSPTADGAIYRTGSDRTHTALPSSRRWRYCLSEGQACQRMEEAERRRSCTASSAPGGPRRRRPGGGTRRRHIVRLDVAQFGLNLRPDPVKVVLEAGWRRWWRWRSWWSGRSCWSWPSWQRRFWRCARPRFGSAS